MDARAFQLSLQPASWNGILFHVSRDEIEAGHRLQTTAIPHGGHVVEAFGPKLRQFKVDAYLTGMDVRGRVALLLNNTTITGKPGTLVLPLYGPKQCRVITAARSWDKDKFGWLAVTIEAQEEPNAPPGPNLTPNGLANQVFSLTGLASAALGPALGALLGSTPIGAVAGVLNGVASGILGNVVGAAAGALSAAISGSVLAGVAQAAIADVGRLVSLAESLRLSPDARVTARLQLGAALAAAPDIAGAPAVYTDALAAFARSGAATAPLPRLLDAMDALPARDHPEGPFLGVVDAAIVRHTESVAAITDAALFLGLAESAAETVFASRAEAVHARARLAAVLADVIERLPSGPLPDLLTEAAGAAATLLNRRITDIAPVMMVEAPASAPALWWAHRLYNDPSRAAEVTTAARAAHPGFLPRRFETAAA